MLFISLVAFSALFVAGCAAFFSIKGLIVLFSGSALAIGIMASSLEIGKLVAASFLHTYWNTASKLLKTYLCVAVFVLMCVTSLGIFGFLSGAYQVHSGATASVETKIETLQLEQAAVNKAIEDSSARIKSLAEIRSTQEERVQAAGNYKAPRDQAYKAIAEANEEIQLKELLVAKDRERVIVLEKDISALKISLNSNTDIGSFKFIASAFGTTIDQAVQYFIFTLICVFDPLAVALVLAWNKLVQDRAEKLKKAEEDYEEEYLAQLKSLNEPAPLEESPAPVVTQKITIPSRELPKDVVKINLNPPEAKKVINDPVSDVPVTEVEPSTVESVKKKRWATAGPNNEVITNG